MRRTTTIAITLLNWLAASAAGITADQAQQVAQQFITRSAVRQAQGWKGAVQLAHAVTSPQGESDYYVFNIGTDSGFVIVGGDDQAPAVWGYSDIGKFDTKRIPENMRWWLAEYQRQLQWLRNHPGARPRNATNVGSNVGPLLTTRWN